MAVKTKATLLTEAGVIRDEIIKNANTATRVGQHLYDVIDSLEDRIANAGGGGGVGDEYATIALMLADQANQSAKMIYPVADATGDTSVTSGYAYYEYLGVANGVIGDYRKLSEEESMDLDLTVYQTKTDNTLNTTSKQVVGAINELDSEVGSLAGDQVILSIFKYTNTSGAL